MVDREVACFHVIRQALHIVRRTREGVGRETKRQGVGLRDRFTEIAYRIDQRQRPERLLVHGQGGVRHVGEHRQRIEVAAIADALSAREQARAARGRIGYQTLHRFDPPRVGQRAELR